MPNWVRNTLTITGSPEQLKTFASIVGKKVKPYLEPVNAHEVNAFNFYNIKAPYKKDIQSYRTGDIWHEWNTNNWGTKWNSCDTWFVDGSGYPIPKLTYVFDTAWSPPRGIIEIDLPKLLKKYKLNTIVIRWLFVEEQNWGGIYIIGSEVNLIAEWDELNSHYEHQLYETDCVCTWDDDEENYYYDCPR